MVFSKVVGFREALLFTTFFVGAHQCFAQPIGGKVSAGQATIAQANGSTTVVTQSSTRAAIDWQSFNVPAGSTVTFRQPSAASVALNRVPGGSPSSINGNLSANGQVWLINPSGVLFGKGAQVDVGALVA